MKREKFSIGSEDLIERVEREYQKCIGCKLCTKGCPMLDIFSDNPKNLLRDLNDEGEFDIDLPYSCMICGYCQEVCPADISFRDLFYRFRQITVEQNGGDLPSHLGTKNVDLHQYFSFSKIFTDDIKGYGETIFFPGCSLMSYDPDMVIEIYRYLSDNIEIGFCNKCCGKPTDFLGKKDKFNLYLSELKEEFKRKNVKKIITGCQNCYMSFVRNIPDMEIVSVYEELDRIGIPQHAKKKYSKLNMEVTVHDPCPTRSFPQIHDSIRNLLKDLGIKTNDMKYTRNKTLCCGMGGMISKTSPAISESHRKRVAGEVEDEIVVSYCQQCVSAMRASKKDSIHILDMIFTENYEDRFKRKVGLLQSWNNRLKIRKIFKEIEDE